MSLAALMGFSPLLTLYLPRMFDIITQTDESAGWMTITLPWVRIFDIFLGSVELISYRGSGKTGTGLLGCCTPRDNLYTLFNIDIQHWAYEEYVACFSQVYSGGFRYLPWGPRPLLCERHQQSLTTTCLVWFALLR